MNKQSWQRKDFDFELPSDLIAQEPLTQRTDSRLLVLRQNEIEHKHFFDIGEFLTAGDTLVINDTKVIQARLHAKKDSGGQAEILVERIIDEHSALCQVRVSKPLKESRLLHIGKQNLEVLGRDGEFYVLKFPYLIYDFLEEHGSTPLPPYIRRKTSKADEERYQTVYSNKRGAVAAPTAGLHFSTELLSALQESGIQISKVTLHVGAGTFQPVRVEDLSLHEMHSEYYEIPKDTIDAIRQTAGRVVAVGTTVVRTLESWAKSGKEKGETSLFITPGFSFKVVDALITNFHLPQSTLLMLVCALSGYDQVKTAYQDAIERQYRFFSYGDAMFCERSDA